MSMETTETLKELLRQSFDIFNVYGKKPAQMRNILLGFQEALKEFSEDVIEYAFREWLKESSAFPTPSDIVKICNEKVARTYVTPDVPKISAPKPSRDKESWHNKNWADFTEEEKAHFIKKWEESPKAMKEAVYRCYEVPEQ